LNLELFIARRLFFTKENKEGISNSVITIAIFGIALGMAVMILSVAIVTGFKEQIRQKVTGFSSHILIANYENNNSYEASPVSAIQSFYPDIQNINGIKHIQTFATKAGIIKTKTNFQGVVLKGIGTDFDWSFFNSSMVDGKTFKIDKDQKNDSVIISRYLASLLKLKTGDPLFMFFINDPIKMRRFIVSGIYSTDLQEFDKLFVLGDIAHVQKLNDWTESQVNGFEVIIDNFDDIERMTKIIKKEVGAEYIKGKEQLAVSNIKESYPQIFDWLDLTNTNVWIILGLMIVVSTFNMISGLFIIILERTNMIGILKALGARNSSISKVFLYHAAFLISKGLLLGNVIGIVLGFIQYKFEIVKLDPSTYYIDSVPVNFKIWHILLLNAGTLIITTLVLIIPSLIISRIRPAKAIKFA
jgi:lipoprotein-releasing system permease protein